MPLYDRDATTSHEIGKVYDRDSTSYHEIGKVYDRDSTSYHEIYSSSLPPKQLPTMTTNDIWLELTEDPYLHNWNIGWVHSSQKINASGYKTLTAHANSECVSNKANGNGFNFRTRMYLVFADGAKLLIAEGEYRQHQPERTVVINKDVTINISGYTDAQKASIGLSCECAGVCSLERGMMGLWYPITLSNIWANP